MKTKVNDELKQHFRPEFLNRVDDIVVFHQLTQDEIVTIVDLMIAKLDERLRDKDMGIELTRAAKDAARRARATTRCSVRVRCAARSSARSRTRCSEKILFGELKPGPIVVVDVEGEGAERVFSFRGEDKAVVPPIDEIVEAVGAGGPTDAPAAEPEAGETGTASA